MPYQSNRRQFLQTAAVTGVGFWVAGGVRAQESKSPNERVQIACIGVGGKGQSDSKDARDNGEVVAICDVDETKLEAAAKTFPKAKKYFDFRKMLEEMDKSIDAVTVSTPDHCHAPAALMAMRMGKHCFVQKPLTHTVYEARLMAEVARQKKVATQMGNQFTAASGLRKAAALVRAGVLGKVSEVHVWTNRPIWPQGGERAPEKPCPANLKWDLWIGAAPFRPYADGYHPFAWRGWWDFGTGALGDMACHTVNMPYMALDLRDPTSIVAQTSGHNKDSYPKWSIITFEFPAIAARPAIKFVWYDGGKRPSDDLLPPREEIVRMSKPKSKGKAKGKGQAKTEKYEPARSGCVVIGEKGKLYAPGDYAQDFLLSGGATEMEVSFPESPGHFVEWINAIKGGPPAMSNFPDYAGKLAETILLGNLAVWADGKKIEWDAKNLKATNAPEVESIIRPTYRQGYTL